MSDSSRREWRFYLDDMIGFAGKVLTYTEGLDQAGFVASGLNYDATLRNLELAFVRERITDNAFAVNSPLNLFPR